MLNHWVRYFPILDLLERAAHMSVLEVGSGSTGMGEFVPKRFVGCDISFASEQMGHWIVPVRASGVRLPFRDGTFSTVLCLDTLEHIPLRDRPAVIRELLRVSGGTVIIGCPQGPAARDADIRLHEWYVRRGKKQPLWLEEHIALIAEFPDQEALREVLAADGHTVRAIRGEAQWLHVMLSKLEDMRIFGRLTRLLSRSPWRQMLMPLLRMIGLSGTYRSYLVADKA